MERWVKDFTERHRFAEPVFFQYFHELRVDILNPLSPPFGNRIPCFFVRKCQFKTVCDRQKREEHTFSCIGYNVFSFFLFCTTSVHKVRFRSLPSEKELLPFLFTFAKLLFEFLYDLLESFIALV